MSLAWNDINTWTYHTMELAALVALWLTAVVLGLSGAELTKVLGCLWYNVLVQFHLNPPQLLSYQLVSVTHRERMKTMPTTVTTSPRLDPRETHSGGWRGVRGAHTTIWRKRHVPPNVTSKNTIGFLSSAASAMAGAVHNDCSRAVKGTSLDR